MGTQIKFCFFFLGILFVLYIKFPTSHDSGFLFEFSNVDLKTKISTMRNSATSWPLKMAKELNSLDKNFKSVIYSMFL